MCGRMRQRCIFFFVEEKSENRVQQSGKRKGKMEKTPIRLFNTLKDKSAIVKVRNAERKETGEEMQKE